MRWFLALLLWGPAAPALDFDTTKPPPRSRIFLYDFARSKSESVGTRILPRRVHARYDATLDRWVWFLSDAKGRLPDPPEALAEGSVVSGAKLGAMQKEENYKLKEDGGWAPTRAGEEYRILVMTSPPKRKLLYPKSQRS